MTGRGERYIAGNHPYDGPEQFADSASVSENRFDYYQKKRSEEPLFQMSAASYGWLLQTARLNLQLQRKAWRQITCPVVLFQAENEIYVSKKEQERFIRKLSRKKNGDAKLFRVKGSRHEIFNSGEKILERCWGRIIGSKW